MRHFAPFYVDGFFIDSLRITNKSLYLMVLWFLRCSPGSVLFVIHSLVNVFFYDYLFIHASDRIHVIDKISLIVEQDKSWKKRGTYLSDESRSILVSTMFPCKKVQALTLSKRLFIYMRNVTFFLQCVNWFVLLSTNLLILFFVIESCLNRRY